MTEYTIRMFEDNDIESFLELYYRVFSDNVNKDWFMWKYVENPFSTHTPIFVASKDSKIVGALPFTALNMSIGSTTIQGLQVTDIMVHPDHRKKGVFTKLTNTALDRYRDTEVDLLFVVANRLSSQGFRKFGWEYVGKNCTYYKILDHIGVLCNQLSCELLKSVPKITMNPFSDRAIYDKDRPLEVVKYSGVPVDNLYNLFSITNDSRISADKTKKFLEWRYSHPLCDYQTYVACDDNNSPKAAVIIDSPEKGMNITRVVDIAPEENDHAIEIIDKVLKFMLEDNNEDQIVVAPTSINNKIAKNCSFISDCDFPYNKLTTQEEVYVNVINDKLCDDVSELTNKSKWRLSFAELDTV